jgi:hypothetical protein
MFVLYCWTNAVLTEKDISQEVEKVVKGQTEPQKGEVQVGWLFPLEKGAFGNRLTQTVVKPFPGTPPKSEEASAHSRQ